MYTKETREKLLKGLPVTILGRTVSVQGQLFRRGEDRFFLEEEYTGYNDFLQIYSAEKLEDIKIKLAPHLEGNNKYRNGIFPYCDTNKLVVRIVEYVLSTYCPGEINITQKPYVKRGKIVMKPRKKDVF